MDAVKVGAAIKLLRHKAGFTQHSLASHLNVTDKAVSKWERGLSVPDISIITKLSVLLNVDVDNLLEGNITYLEKNWQGLMMLKEDGNIYAGSEAYGKPLVYFYLSYFMLAGIGEIYIDCPERDRKYIEDTLEDGQKYGISLKFTKKGEFPEKGNTMVVYNNPFIYGPNLTKYFQRAMSRMNGISVLTVPKAASSSEIAVLYDSHRAVRTFSGEEFTQFCAPILFFPKKYAKQVKDLPDIESLEPLYAEPMGNGMVEYTITDEDSLWDTSSLLYFLKKRMGKDVYDLAEIAKNRNFI